MDLIKYVCIPSLPNMLRPSVSESQSTLESVFYPAGNTVAADFCI
jgi:hypothetical protein